MRWVHILGPQGGTAEQLKFSGTTHLLNSGIEAYRKKNMSDTIAMKLYYISFNHLYLWCFQD